LKRWGDLLGTIALSGRGRRKEGRKGLDSDPDPVGEGVGMYRISESLKESAFLRRYDYRGDEGTKRHMRTWRRAL